MATIPYKRVDEAEGLTREIYENIMRTYGSDAPHGIYQLMGHTPEFLAASWPRSRHLYGNDSNFSLRDKHILTLGISAINNCEYCVRIHTDRGGRRGQVRRGHPGR
jgi:AhpD family alkylhydroperoxidase